jgi:hypothetical protein
MLEQMSSDHWDQGKAMASEIGAAAATVAEPLSAETRRVDREARAQPAPAWSGILARTRSAADL